MIILFNKLQMKFTTLENKT